MIGTKKQFPEVRSQHYVVARERLATVRAIHSRYPFNDQMVGAAEFSTASRFRRLASGRPVYLSLCAYPAQVQACMPCSFKTIFAISMLSVALLKISSPRSRASFAHVGILICATPTSCVGEIRGLPSSSNWRKPLSQRTTASISGVVAKATSTACLRAI